MESNNQENKSELADGQKEEEFNEGVECQVSNLQNGKTSNVDKNPDLNYSSKKEVCKGGVLGFFIGLAVIVPGVSGSAVAIIF